MVENERANPAAATRRVRFVPAVVSPETGGRTQGRADEFVSFRSSWPANREANPAALGDVDEGGSRRRGRLGLTEHGAERRMKDREVQMIQTTAEALRAL